MSRVFLIPDNDYFGKRTAMVVELTEEILSWPMRTTDRIDDFFPENWQFILENTYKNALKALMSLGQFDSEFCLRVNMTKKILYKAYRCWGRLLLNNEEIVIFSHDTRFKNNFFESLFEWPETERPENVGKWSEQQWKTFFIERIIKTATDDLSKAKLAAKLVNEDLEKQQKRTDAILLAIKNV